MLTPSFRLNPGVEQKFRKQANVHVITEQSIDADSNVSGAQRSHHQKP